MKQTFTVDQLKEALAPINALVADPEPGLFTWHGILNERLEQLAVLLQKAGFGKQKE